MKLSQLNHEVLNVSHFYHIFDSKNVTAIKIFVKYIRSISGMLTAYVLIKLIVVAH